MLLLAREVLAPSLDRRREMRLLEGSENGTCRPSAQFESAQDRARGRDCGVRRGDRTPWRLLATFIQPTGRPLAGEHHTVLTG